MFSKNNLAKAAREIADHLQIVENIKALQTGQKERADAFKALSDKVWEIQIEIRALKAETIKDALKETSTVVGSVQGGLNQRLEDISVRLALAERDIGSAAHMSARAPQLSLGQSVIKQLDHPDP